MRCKNMKRLAGAKMRCTFLKHFLHEPNFVQEPFSPSSDNNNSLFNPTLMEMYVQTWRLFTTEQTKASWFCSPSKAFTFPFHRKLSCYRSQIKPCQCASVGNYSYVLRVSRESNQVAIDFYVGQTETPTIQPIKRSIINTLHPLLLLMDDAAARHKEAKHSRKKESQKSGGRLSGVWIADVGVKWPMAKRKCIYPHEKVTLRSYFPSLS